MNRSGNKIERYGISFDSLLELDIYEEFIKQGVTLERGTPIIVEDKFDCNIICYSNDNKNFEIKPESKNIRKIEYTPDFICNYENKKAYIELKGFANETFRYRWKLFKKYLQANESDSMIFLIKRRHNGRVKPNDNLLRIKETEQIVSNIIEIIKSCKEK